MELGTEIIYFYDDGSMWLAKILETPKAGVPIVFRCYNDNCPGGTQTRNVPGNETTPVGRATSLAQALGGLEKWATKEDVISWTDPEIFSNGDLDPEDYLEPEE